VAILVHLTDGSDLIAYAGLSTVEATVRVLASSPAYREHRQSLSGVAPWTTLALVALCVLLAGVVVVVVFA
jgi:hypothetical protein